MHARLDRYNGQPGHRAGSPDPADLSTSVAGQPGLLSCLTFRQLAGPAVVCLTLWDTEASATRCPGAEAGLALPASELYHLSSVIVTLATSVETLDAAQRAVMATELTPGEDPALLPGPDRVEIHRVTGHHLPAARPAASTRGH